MLHRGKQALGLEQEPLSGVNLPIRIILSIDRLYLSNLTGCPREEISDTRRRKQKFCNRFQFETLQAPRITISKTQLLDHREAKSSNWRQSSQATALSQNCFVSSTYDSPASLRKQQDSKEVPEQSRSKRSPVKHHPVIRDYLQPPAVTVLSPLASSATSILWVLSYIAWQLPILLHVLPTHLPHLKLGEVCVKKN